VLALLTVQGDDVVRLVNRGSLRRLERDTHLDRALGPVERVDGEAKASVFDHGGSVLLDLPVNGVGGLPRHQRAVGKGRAPADRQRATAPSSAPVELHLGVEMLGRGSVPFTGFAK
jgi:hypothetical protein